MVEGRFVGAEVAKVAGLPGFPRVETLIFGHISVIVDWAMS
jgi:hypothetical protein